MFYDYRKLSVKEFVEIKKNKQIKLDPSFQVGTDKESRWDLLQQSKYIRSVLLGSAPSPFVVVNNELAYQSNLDRGNDNSSIDYFGNLKKDYLWLSIDGNNRSIALRNFVDNKVRIPAGSYPLKSGLFVNIKRGYNDRFDKMEKPLQKQFMDSIVLVAEYSDVLWSDLGPLFRNINDGIGLNGQQKRQSNPSPIADYVRNMRAKFEKSLRHLYKNKDFIMLKGDEWIVKCMAYVGYSKNVGGSILDKIYMKPHKMSQLVKPAARKASEFSRVMKNVLNDIKVGVSNVSANSVFDYFVINWEWSQENIRVVNRKKVYAYWLEVVSGMTSNDSADYPSPKLDEQEVIGSDGKVEKEGVMYNWKLIVRKGEAAKNVFGDYRRKVVREKIESKLFSNGYLIQTSDDDYYSDDDKRILWENQNGVCPCDRKDCVKNIPIEEICDGSKWHGDAKLPRALGGKHDIPNGQLMCKVQNQVLGAKPKEQHQMIGVAI